MRGMSVLIAGTFLLSFCKGASADEIDDALSRCMGIPRAAETYVYVCSGNRAEDVFRLLSSRYGNYDASVSRRRFGKLRATNSMSERTYCYQQTYYIRYERKTYYTCLYRHERSSQPDDDNDNAPGVPTWIRNWKS
jgi:hypothetical protein